MGQSASMRAGLWLDGVTVAAQDLRLQVTEALLYNGMTGGSTAIAARQGVRQGSNAAPSLSVAAASGMNITVNPGIAFVQGTTASNSGIYTAILDTAATITVATSDPTNPRIDNVIVQITDNGNNTSTTVVTLQTGTPAPSPSAPALPPNSLLLATVSVAASTSSIVSGNITDKRAFTVALGGILPVTSLPAGGAMAASSGQYAHDQATGRLRVGGGNGGTTAGQPLIAAFAPVVNNGADRAVPTGSWTVLATATVTVDGATEVAVFGSWGWLTPASGTAVGDFVNLALFMDGSGGLGNSATGTVRFDSTSINLADGGTVSAWVTPSAGSHTFTLVGQTTGSHAATVNAPYIRAASSVQQ